VRGRKTFLLHENFSSAAGAGAAAAAHF